MAPVAASRRGRRRECDQRRWRSDRARDPHHRDWRPLRRWRRAFGGLLLLALPRPRLWWMVPLVPVFGPTEPEDAAVAAVAGSASALLGAFADQPVIHAGKQLSSILVQTWVSVHRIQDGRRLAAEFREWDVSEQASQRVWLQLEQLLHLGDSLRIRRPTALLPLPHRAGSSANGAGHRSLRQAHGTAGLPQALAECLPLLRRRHSGSTCCPASVMTEDARFLVTCRGQPSRLGKPIHTNRIAFILCLCVHAIRGGEAIGRGGL